MKESPKKYFEEMCEEMADRVTISKQGDVVSLGCDDSEHAMRVFSLLERLGDTADAFGFFEVTNGRKPRFASLQEPHGKYTCRVCKGLSESAHSRCDDCVIAEGLT